MGTAKPSSHQLATIKHHLVNSHSVKDSFDAATFEEAALKILARIFKDQNTAVMAGGSGLYIRAVCEGIDPHSKVGSFNQKRANFPMAKERDLKGFWKSSRRMIRNTSLLVDLKNPQRVIRAIEVFRTTGRPFSEFRSGRRATRDFRTLKMGLDLGRDELFQRIDTRIDQMVNVGLFEEVRNLRDFRHLNALQTVGYKEVFDFFDGKYDQDEAIDLLKRNTRRYAKRQLTWFKKDPEVNWFPAQDSKRIKNYVKKWVTS